MFVISSFECKYLIRETGLRDFQLFMLISLFFSKIVHLPYWLLVSNPKLRKQVWHFHQDHLVEILPWHRRAFDRGSWRKRVQEALLSTLWVDLKIEKNSFRYFMVMSLTHQIVCLVKLSKVARSSWNLWNYPFIPFGKLIWMFVQPKHKQQFK